MNINNYLQSLELETLDVLASFMESDYNIMPENNHQKIEIKCVQDVQVDIEGDVQDDIQRPHRIFQLRNDERSPIERNFWTKPFGISKC